MIEALGVFMRWLHLSSVAALIGGMSYASAVWAPAAGKLDAAAKAALAERAAARFRRIVLAATGGLLLSGVYNILTNAGHSTRYKIVLGIKLLLVAHIFAAALAASRPHYPRRARVLAGGAISGFVVIAISTYLRQIF
jgi:putative copper export protein